MRPYSESRLNEIKSNSRPFDYLSGPPTHRDKAAMNGAQSPQDGALVVVPT